MSQTAQLFPEKLARAFFKSRKEIEMKRTIIFVVLVLALALTSCAPQVPAYNPSQNQDINIEINVDAGASGSGQAAQAEAKAEATAQATAVTALTQVPFAQNTLPCGAPIPPGITEPIQIQDMVDSICYPNVIKGKIGDTYYCAAKAWNAVYPNGFVQIETFPKDNGNGNYLSADPTFEFSMNKFCGDDPVTKHFAPAGTKWNVGLMEEDGFHPASFPLK